jgi:hypothetical protein
MKPHARRESNNYPYYKLATWDTRSMTFRDGRQAFVTKFDAVQSCPGPGRYRVSVVTADGRRDLEPFDVGEMVGGD